MVLKAQSFLEQHWRSEWSVEGFGVSIEEALPEEDPRSYDSTRGSVLEALRLEGALEVRKLEKVEPSVHQQHLPTEVALLEARCQTEVQEALRGVKKERHCRMGMAVALVEKDPS